MREQGPPPVEAFTTIHAPSAATQRVLLSADRFGEWVAPHVRVVSSGPSLTLGPGDRFGLEVFGLVAFQYVVEAVTEREVIFTFRGPWQGQERWSFIADGRDTLVRRRYEVSDAVGLADLTWRTIGRAMVMTHFQVEMPRFRNAVERTVVTPSELESRGPTSYLAPNGSSVPFPVDDG